MIYVFLAPGFEEVEALAPVDLLRRAKKDVRTVSIGERLVTSSRGIPVMADCTDENLSTEDLEAIVLPGGLPGATNLEKSPVVQKMIDYAVEKGLLIAAICAAPSILGHKGLLKGKKATSAPGFQPELEGAVLSDEYVCLDGAILTARGMGVSTQFGLKLVELLASPEQAREIRAAIQWEE